MLKYGKNKVYLVNVHLYQVTDHLQNRNIREYFIIVTAKCIKYTLSKIYKPNTWSFDIQTSLY